MIGPEERRCKTINKYVLISNKLFGSLVTRRKSLENKYLLSGNQTSSLNSELFSIDRKENRLYCSPMLDWSWPS